MFGLFGYLVLALALNSALFLIAYRFQTDRLTDASYAITFLVLTSFALVSTGPSVGLIIVSSMVTLWAIRLGGFLLIRIRRMKRDVRFDAIRGSFIRFLGFWVLQGAGAWIILLPILLFAQSDVQNVLWSGALVWLAGLLIESIADVQKYRFTADPQNVGRFMSTGLWRYSRHPNYFGEILCWVGVFLFVLPSLSFVERFVAFASPLFITFILFFGTGIPILERIGRERYGRSYEEYARRTSILVPWPPKP